MLQETRLLAFVALVAGLVFFTNLGAGSLFDEDEPKNAVCGREMFARNDWIVPTFNEDLRTDKPILIYWTMLGSFRLFGVNEFAARWGSACCSVLTTLLVYLLGRRLFNPDVGKLAAIVQATSLLFCLVGRACTPDAFLICTVTAAFTAFVYSNRSAWEELQKSQIAAHWKWRDFAPKNVWSAIPMYAAMGLAVLAKGPVGVVLPCAVIGLFLLILQQSECERSRFVTMIEHGTPASSKRDWSTFFTFNTLKAGLFRLLQLFGPLRFLRALAAMRFLTGIVVVSVIAFPWYIAVGVETNGAWLQGFLGGHNVGRFLKPMEDHRGPIVYYIPVLLIGCFPWSVLLPWAVWRSARDGWKAGSVCTGPLFLWCWAGVWITVFSMASTKLPNYVLPTYPALSLITALALQRWRGLTGTAEKWVLQSACGWWGAVGGLAVVGLPIAARFGLPEAADIGWIGWSLVVGSLGVLIAVSFQRRQLAIQIGQIMALVFVIGLVDFVPAKLNPFQDGPYFARYARRLPGTDGAMGTFEYSAPSLIFYHGERVHSLGSVEQVAGFFEEHPRGVIVTQASRLDRLKAHLPAEIEVLHQRRRFLRQTDLILLGTREITRPLTVAQGGSR